MSKELIITEQTTNKICNELMNGMPLARLAKQKDMPSLTRIYKEIAKDKNFLARINEARRIGAQTYIENAMSELETADNRNIMVVREKVQLAKWMASKLIPIYGDKQEIKQETKIEIQWSTPENKMVDVRLTYDKGLDKYYGLLDIAEKYNIFKKVSTRYELPDGSKQYGKSIMNDPEKYFTKDIMDKIEESVGKEFKYG